ncbi:MAG TPA: hypothetical protein ENK57_01450 [Polyangiaceae bacterium]|nr:hypothetical protein [Polyangiaceae bacterium]
MGKKRKKTKLPRARVSVEHALGVQEASAVARLPSGRFLVVDDEKGVFRCSLGTGESADAELLEAARGLSDLEGICLDGEGTTAWLLAERDGAVWKHAVEDDDLRPGRRVGTLPNLNKRKNHGWEGVGFAPAGSVAPAATLVAVHQTKPRCLGLFDVETLRPQRLLHLPKDAKKTLGELNDVTVSRDGFLVVVSGKAGVVAELKVADDALEIGRVARIEHDDDVPEGITFDAEGRLWIVTDGRGWLREIAF